MRQPPSPPEQERLRGASICQVMRDNGCSTTEQLRDKIFDELRAANAPRHIQIAQTAEPAQPTNVAQPIAAQPIAAQPARPSESAQVTEPVQGAHPKRKIFILSTKLSTSSEYIIAVYTTAQHANFTALRYAAKAFSIYRTEIMDFIPVLIHSFTLPPSSLKQSILKNSKSRQFVDAQKNANRILDRASPLQENNM
jgi:hypothetical protein